MSREMKDSGVEWIGEIPEDWDVKQLRTYFSRRINKNTHLQENNLLSLSYGRIIRKNIDTKEGLLPESFDGYNIVENGDIVIRGTDLQNDHRSLRTGLVTERGIITSAYMTLKPKENVNSAYYHYLLHCYDMTKVFYSMGGGLRQSLDYWEFIRMPVLHPTDREQEEIISYIKTKCTAIDTAIEKTKKSIEKLEEYKKAVITKAVTKGIDPNAKMKDSGVEWIGEIPENWAVMKTKYLFRILKRIAGQEGFDVISITQKGLKIKDINSNEGQIAENYSNYQFVFPGDFAMNHMDLLTGWVDLSTLTGVTSPDYRVFHKINESVNDDYYKYVFQSLYFNKVYYGLAQGVAEVGRKRLQAPAFKELKLPCPPADEPAKIAAYIKDKCMAIDALIGKKQTAINKWEEYKKSLIYYAVTGKIDCRNEVI